MKILKFFAQNALRLFVVEIDANGDPVILGGPNGAGKSAILRSIVMALEGKKAIPDQPVRDGEDSSKIELQIGESENDKITITRKTNAATGRTTLTVERDGARLNEPQGFLNQMIGPLTFDPCAFKAAKPAEQFRMLSELVGLDFTRENEERSKAYAQRTTAGREVTRLESELETHMFHDNLPAEEVSVAELSAQLEAALETKRVVTEKFQASLTADTALSEIESEFQTVAAEEEGSDDRFLEASGVRCAEHDERIAALVRDFAAEEDRLRREHIERRDRIEREQAERQALIETRKQSFETAREVFVAAQDAVVDPQPIRDAIATAEATNSQIRENQARTRYERQLEAAEGEVMRLTRQIEAIDEAKQTKLEETDFPVPGLTIGDDKQVYFEGHPLNQASDAEQLRVSVAMALAMNPKLRILLVPAGEKLDRKSLKMVYEMAAEADTQLWLERHMVDDATTVIIEEGRVVQPEDWGEEPAEA